MEILPQKELQQMIAKGENSTKLSFLNKFEDLWRNGCCLTLVSEERKFHDLSYPNDQLKALEIMFYEKCFIMNNNFKKPSYKFGNFLISPDLFRSNGSKLVIRCYLESPDFVPTLSKEDQLPEDFGDEYLVSVIHTTNKEFSENHPKFESLVGNFDEEMVVYYNVNKSNFDKWILSFWLNGNLFDHFFSVFYKSEIL